MTSNIPHTGSPNDITAALRQGLDLASDDRRRLDVYLQHAEQLLRQDPLKGKALIDDALLIALRLRDEDAEARLRMYRGLAYLATGSADQAITDLTELYEYHLADTSPATERILDTARLALALGRACLQLGHRQRALQWLMSAARHCDDVSDETSVEILLETGNTLREMNRGTEALRLLLRALWMCESFSNTTMAGLVHYALGNTYESLGALDAAREHFSYGLQIFKGSNDVRAAAAAMTDLSRVEIHSGNADAALNLALHAHTTFSTLQDCSGVAAAAIALGDIYEVRGESGRAIDFYVQAYNFLPEYSADNLRLTLLICIGSHYHRNKEADSAIFTFEQALEFAKRLGDRSAECRVHRELSVIYQELEQYAAAIKHVRIAEAMHLEQTSDHLLSVFTEFNASFDEGRLKQQLARAQERVSELEQKVAEMQREMQARVLELYEKTELLRELQTKFVKLHKVPNDTKSRALDEINIMLARSSQGEGGRWEDFRHQFDALYPDFLSRIAQYCPELTSTELTICSLTRLNLSAKQIAEILHIAPRTVDTHQARIRKKLQLSRTINLKVFISSF